MNEDERKMIYDTHEMAKRVHDFWFEKPLTGGPTRAEQFDEGVTFVRTSKTTIRVFSWIPAAIITAAATFAALKGWFAK